MPTDYATFSFIFAFSILFCFSCSKESVSSISSCPLQPSTLSVPNLPDLHSSEATGRSTSENPMTFSNHPFPCLFPFHNHWWMVLPSWDCSTSLILTSFYSKTDKLLFSHTQIFQTLFHVFFCFCLYILFLRSLTHSYDYLLVLCWKWKIFISRLLLRHQPHFQLELYKGEKKKKGT